MFKLKSDTIPLGKMILSTIVELKLTIKSIKQLSETHLRVEHICSSHAMAGKENANEEC